MKGLQMAGVCASSQDLTSPHTVATQLIRDGEARMGRKRTPIIALSANAFSDQVSAYKKCRDGRSCGQTN